MKKYTIIFLLMIAGVTASCEPDIDLKPESTLTYNGFWDTEEAARSAHVGLYSSFRGYHATLWGLGEIRSDFYGGPTVESHSSLDLINQNISATNVPYGNWANFYVLIHRINDFLYNIDNVAFINEADKQHMIGQVYGMRAFVYYTMLKTWGEVPITTEPLLDVNPSELAKARSSREEVMALIKSDLQNSLTAFGDNTSFWNAKKTYWSKAATLTLKGDAYIWSGNLLGGGTTDFTEAKNALMEVQNMGFTLVDDYDDLWGEGNENNAEFIFKLDYTQDQAGNFYGGQFTGRSTEINALFTEDGTSMAGFITNGGNRYGPTLELLARIDNPLDERDEATFTKLYDAKGNYVMAIMNKFLGSVEAGSRLSNNDVPIYRYAEVVLLLAEAKTRLGEDPSEEINLIRERAYGANYDPSLHAFVDGSEKENINTILDERLREFVGEGKRWWDLRRAGNEFVFEAIDNLDQSVAYKLEFPITRSMIANNTLLEQTDGYVQ